jgi:hypothetical protein
LLFHVIDKSILGMSLLRIFSGLVEISAAIVFIKMNDVGKALVLNSTLALLGPCILILTTAVGLIGLAEKISIFRIVVIFIGVGCILYGIKAR